MLSAKRIVLFFAVAIVLGILLLLGINSFLAWQAQSKFDARIAAIRAAGEPATLSDLAPGSLPADKNSAAIIAQIGGDLQAYGGEIFAFEQTDLGKTWDDGQPLTTEQLAAVKHILDTHPAILTAVHDAAACEAYTSLSDFKVDSHRFIDQLVPSVQRFRALANFVSTQMAALSAEGKQDEAIKLGAELLKLNKYFDQEPAVIGYLVSVAVRGITLEALNLTLQSGPVSPEVRAQLDAQLAQDDNLGPLAHAMITERAFAVTNIADQTSGFARMLGWPATNWMLGQLELLDRAVAASKLSADELRPNRLVTAGDLKKPAPLQGVAEDKNIGTAIMSAFNLEFRRLAQTRALRVLNSLGEYRQRTGKDADSLDQLSLPKSATIDPWTGKPLIIKKTEKGWVVYSVGQNGTDDGGRFEKMDDVGFGPPGYGHETNENRSDAREEPDAKQPRIDR
jgi:hypothetical protein